MSHCEDPEGDGKHRVIFLTKEDADPSTSKVTLPEVSSTAAQGLISDDGSINWNCPCLGGMAVGPCGVEFRAAFECFHFSEAEPKGSDCMEKFMGMQDCMRSYPELYEEPDKGEKDIESASELLDDQDKDTREEQNSEEKAKSS